MLKYLFLEPYTMFIFALKTLNQILKKEKNEKVTNYIILIEPLFIDLIGARLSILSIAQSYR